jgi:hypothetical protein
MTSDIWISERMTPMKTTLAQSPLPAPMTAGAAATRWYQIYRQTRDGIYAPGLQTDLAATAVEIFLRQSPVFDGGDIRLWDHQQQRTCASVKWTLEKTAFGFLVHRRTNVFYDRHLAEIAREIQVREFVREVSRHELAMMHSN